MLSLIFGLVVFGLVAGLFGFYNLKSASFGLAQFLVIVSIIFLAIAGLLALGLIRIVS